MLVFREDRITLIVSKLLYVLSCVWTLQEIVGYFDSNMMRFLACSSFVNLNFALNSTYNNENFRLLAMPFLSF